MEPPIPMCSVIGRNVARRRDTMGLTQDGLARLLRATGVQWTGVTVAKVETGTREIRAGELVALGMALGLRPAELLESSEPTQLAPCAEWVPGEAVTTWARGDDPSVHQRAQWAKDAVPGSAPLGLLDERARRVAAYLSHVPSGRRPTRLSMADVDQQTARVAEIVETWANRRRADGVVVTDSARRAKERHAWAAVTSAREHG